MSYAEDLAALARYGKLRLASVIVAVGAWLAELLVGLAWLPFLAAAGWGFAGVFALLEARTQKRLGRDGDGSILYAVILFIIAAYFFVSASKG